MVEELRHVGSGSSEDGTLYDELEEEFEVPSDDTPGCLESLRQHGDGIGSDEEFSSATGDEAGRSKVPTTAVCIGS